jgi:hypothetical protein
MTVTPTPRPSNWHQAKAVDLVSYDDGRVWSLDVRLESGERIGLELSKFAVLTLARSLAEWKERIGSSPTGRRDFAKHTSK